MFSIYFLTNNPTNAPCRGRDKIIVPSGTSFKTTLESALEAELLIIVCDLSDANYKKHLEVTQEVLEDLGIENKDQIVVFTKKDNTFPDKEP